MEYRPIRGAKIYDRILSARKIVYLDPNSGKHEVSFPKGALNLRVEKWLDDYEVASRESNEKNYGFAIL